MILSGFLFQVTSGTLEETRSFTLTLGKPDGLDKWLQLRFAEHFPLLEPAWHSSLKLQAGTGWGEAAKLSRRQETLKRKSDYFFQDTPLPTKQSSSLPPYWPH